MLSYFAHYCAFDQQNYSHLYIYILLIQKVSMHYQHHHQNTHTHLHDYYNSFIAEDKNQVWAAALTLAWKGFSHHVGQNILVNKRQDIADKYNKCPFNSECLEDKCYYVKCGAGQHTVDLINKQMKLKFPDNSMAPVDVNLGQNGIISYAYLFKQLLFPVQFQKYPDTHLSWKGQDDKENKYVKSFYVETDEQSRQIFSHQYKSHDDFVVQIKNSTLKDKIYLVKHPQTSVTSVASIIQKINLVEHENKPSMFVWHVDEFQMPVIDLNYSHSHKELIGASIKNHNFHGFEISQMIEGLKLKIDEKGVICENQAYMFVDECGHSRKDQKLLIFNTPFWVVLKEQGHHPYLCVHINNIK